ncbi:MAG TPA: ribosomal L7Ae/L30e/S12e/Gadd45 family protein [Gemmatimonadaceae bacterium]|jgi:ribosomal protein L7Ae-like RNA K-turn-binding protein|nr:ribosomal L7Ae/L30e/S12e/Gadd45 family protein [Gemmatimonadaceae bacterium]
MDELTTRKLLRLLGVGLRGRLVVVGVERVREAAQRGKLKLAVIAPDASRHSLAKVVPMLRAKRIRLIEGPAAAELGAAVGREATATVGVVDVDLARGIRALVGPAPAEGRTADSMRAR